MRLAFLPEILVKSKLVGTCLLLLAAACQTVSPTTSQAVARDYVFLQLMSGPRSATISKEEAAPVFAGHMANIQKLAAEGKLLLAGPYGTPKRDPDLRGVFVLATPDTERAQALAATDPGVIAGVFRTEAVRMRTRAPLEAYIEHELALQAQAQAQGQERSPAEGMRSYVWLTAEHGRRARQALLEVPEVLLWGDLADGRAIALVDAQDTDACTKVLGEHAGQIGPYVLDPWYGSGELVKLPQMLREGAGATP